MSSTRVMIRQCAGLSAAKRRSVVPLRRVKWAAVLRLVGSQHLKTSLLLVTCRLYGSVLCTAAGHHNRRLGAIKQFTVALHPTPTVTAVNEGVVVKQGVGNLMYGSRRCTSYSRKKIETKKALTRFATGQPFAKSSPNA